jgi:hypothetical protein
MKRFAALRALLFISAFSFPLSAFPITDPSTHGLKIDANGNLLPSSYNGHPLNLPADTTVNGMPIEFGGTLGSANDRGVGSEVWISDREIDDGGDGKDGIGTKENPFNGGTRAKFDAIITGYKNAGTTHITFHLPDGTFYTNGGWGGVWTLLDDWHFVGAGIDRTIIIQVPGTGDYNGAVFQHAASNNNQSVEELTIACAYFQSYGDYSDQTTFSGIQISGAGSYVRNVKVTGSGSVAAADCFAVDIESFGNDSITDGAFIDHAVVVNNGPHVDGPGVGNTNSGSSGLRLAHGGRVVNCYVDGAQTFGVGLPADFDSGEVAGNTILNCGVGISQDSFTSKGIHVHHNTITNTATVGDNVGINVNNAGIAIGCTFDHNGITVHNGIIFNNVATNCVVSDNTFNFVAGSNDWAIGLTGASVTSTTLKNNIIGSGLTFHNSGSVGTTWSGNRKPNGAAVTGLGDVVNFVIDGDAVTPRAFSITQTGVGAGAFSGAHTLGPLSLSSAAGMVLNVENDTSNQAAFEIKLRNVFTSNLESGLVVSPIGISVGHHDLPSLVGADIAGNVKISGLTASQFVETDSSKVLVSKTAGQMRTDLGLVLGTSAGNVPVLDGSGKLNSSVLPVTAQNYKGVWDSSANSPALSSGTGTPGDFYYVSVASSGAHTIDGISTWTVGDMMICNATPAWERVPTASAVTSVAGRTGAITLGAADLSDANTVGQNIIKLTDLGDTTFLRINDDNSVDQLNASDFRTAIGLGGLGSMANQSDTGVSTAIQKGNGTGGLTPAVSSTDYVAATSGSAIQKANGAGGLTAAVASVDYIAATTGSAIQKASGGGLTAATAGTDFQAAPVVTSVSFASIGATPPAVGSTGACVVYNIGTLTGPLTIGAPTGTPKDGQVLKFRFVEDGTGTWAITWNSAYVFGTDITTAMIPTAAGAKFEIVFQWNATDGKWRCVGLARGF